MTLKTSSEKPGITPAWAGKSDIYETLGTDPEDHPRVGGEKPRPQSWQTASSGSPPRGRGKGGKLPGRVRPEGITPAWAGKRQPRRPSNRDRRDHPRVGGEKTWTPCKQCMTLGSPPRRRGKALHSILGNRPGGITPAWAGKSGKLYRRHMGAQDHPRMGGEKRPR